MPPLRAWFLALAGGALAACGGGVAPRADVAPHPRIKLAEHEAGTLHPAAPVADGDVLIDEDFQGESVEELFTRWSTLDDGSHPLVRTGDLEVALGQERGKPHVTLSGTRGALFRIVPVAPSTTYRVRAELRARGVEPDDGSFQGARPWLAELSRHGPDDELLADIEPLIVERHLFPADHEVETFHERSKTFRTGPGTHALIVACTLSLNDRITGGAVDFRSFFLRRISDRRHREALLASALEDFRVGEPEPEGWRAQRRVRAVLGADVRPGIVLFPGERLELELAIPSGRPRFESGAGPWRPALADALIGRLPGATELFVRVDGEELARRRCAPPGRLVDARWDELEIDLEPYRGRTVRLELGVEGDLPGVFGAPSLRDLDFVSDRMNVLLVSIDTLRVDRLGSYGYEHGITPRLDAFAEQAVRFEQAYSQAPYTLPSHASLFSGQVPTVHGIQRGGQVFSSVRSPILARILSARGYTTSAMTGGGFVKSDFGFDKGFDTFVPVDPLRHRDSKHFEAALEREPDMLSEEVIRQHGVGSALAFLERHADEPFFLFLHTYAVHDYDPPSGWVRCASRGCMETRTDLKPFRLSRDNPGRIPAPSTPEERAHASHRYDDALTYVDDLLGNVLDQLARLGLKDKTIVVVTTDHGEEIFDRGFVQHGKTLYEEITHIPLLFRVPGEPPRVVADPVMSIDVLPTLLRLLGLPGDERMQGLDLLGATDPDRVTWSEVDEIAHVYAVRKKGEKLIWNPPDSGIEVPPDLETELYDLLQDPGERTNRAREAPGRSEAMRELLDRSRALFEGLGSALGAAGSSALDPEMLRELEDLGYGGEEDPED